MQQPVAYASALAGAAVLLILALAPTAAATSQAWYLTDTLGSVDQGPGNDVMEKGSGVGAGPVTLAVGSANIWVADQAAINDVDFGTGAWSLTLDCTTGGAGATWEMGSVTGGVFTPVAGSGGTISSPSCGTADFTPSSSFTVASGSFLAMRITDEAADFVDTVIDTIDGGDADSNSDSFLDSPATDPGYPTPNWSTLILLAMGIIMVVSAVWWNRRGSEGHLA